MVWWYADLTRQVRELTSDRGSFLIEENAHREAHREAAKSVNPRLKTLLMLRLFLHRTQEPSCKDKRYVREVGAKKHQQKLQRLNCF